MSTKTINFRLPTYLYEEFYRAFPGHGERSKFLRRMVARGVAMRRMGRKEESKHWTHQADLEEHGPLYNKEEE